MRRLSEFLGAMQITLTSRFAELGDRIDICNLYRYMWNGYVCYLRESQSPN